MPIRLRVTLVFAGVMAILLIALGLFIYLRFQKHLNEAINVNLGSRADEVAALVLSNSTSGKPRGRPLAGSEEVFAQVSTPAGEIIDTTKELGGKPVLTSTELAQAAVGQIFVEHHSVPGLEGHARLLAKPVKSDDRTLIVVVGQALDDRDEALQSLSALLLVGGLAALILASVAGYGTVAAALRPVEAMRRRAAEISAADPEERMPVSTTQDELSRLAETLNEMLGRLEVAIDRERTFVDNASHELRTPLAMHKTELELALRYGDSVDELKAAIASSIEEADRLVQLSEDLLVVARSQKGRLAIELQPVEVRKLLDGVRERFAARAAEANRSIVVDAAEGIRIDADRLRLEQALTNMVDNALRHGTGEIRLRAVKGAQGVELHVEDDGQGLPPEFLDRAFERFTQADAARAGGGSGLGLAIVDAIARAHRGAARAANRPGGGVDVWIELPTDQRPSV